jgi:hypothetical protein
VTVVEEADNYCMFHKHLAMLIPFTSTRASMYHIHSAGGDSSLILSARVQSSKESLTIVGIGALGVRDRNRCRSRLGCCRGLALDIHGGSQNGSREESKSNGGETHLVYCCQQRDWEIV